MRAHLERGAETRRRRLERHRLLLGDRVMKLRVERRAQQLREFEPEVAIDQRLAIASQDGRGPRG